MTDESTTLDDDVYALLRRRQAAQDPDRQSLVNALQSLGQAPERSPLQLGENLLASALYQYALRQQDQPAGLPDIDPDQGLAGLLPGGDAAGNALAQGAAGPPRPRDDLSTLDLTLPAS